MTFHEQPFSSRYGQMGDAAERAFTDWCDEQGLPYVRYGLSRPPISMKLLPARIRHTPDFVQSRRFVECQGCGRDGVVKLKVEKWGALHHWDGIRTAMFDGVWLFIWDSHKKRSCILPLVGFDEMLNEQLAELRYFHESKPYWAFPVDAVFEKASDAATRNAA